MTPREGAEGEAGAMVPNGQMRGSDDILFILQASQGT